MEDAEARVEAYRETAAVIVEGYGENDGCIWTFDWRSGVHFARARLAGVVIRRVVPGCETSTEGDEDEVLTERGSVNIRRLRRVTWTESFKVPQMKL